MTPENLPLGNWVSHPGLLLALVFSMSLPAWAAISPLNGPTSFSTDDDFLNYVEQETFNYFWTEANPSNGLIPDKSGASRCSIAAVGFGLSGINIGIERGWITRSEGAARALTTLQTFSNLPQGTNATGEGGYQGWFYHYLDMNTGLRYGTAELSTEDTSLLMLGVLDAGRFFDNPTNAIELQIRQISSNLLNNVNWPWALGSDNLVYMHWTPESGFNGVGGWRGGNEAYLVYLLGLGSPTTPLPAASWAAWTSTYNWQSYYGFSYIYKAPLFIHQYVHCWFDLNAITDDYMRGKGSDYFEDARRAALAQNAYGLDNPAGYSNYSSNEWGWSSCSGPGNQYVVCGAPGSATFDNGTIAPTAAAGSMPFAPEICLPTLQHLYFTYTNQLWTTEGFRDAFNVTSNHWFAPWANGINQGPILIMIENYRTAFTWRRMLGSPIVQAGLQAAGFTAPPPDQLTATVLCSTQLNLSWRDLSAYETGFEVQAAGSDLNFSPCASLGPGATNALIPITPGSVYYFRVATASAAGLSGFRETNRVFIGTTSNQLATLLQYTFDGTPTDPILNTNNFGTTLDPTTIVPGLSASPIHRNDAGPIALTTFKGGYPTDPVLRVWPGNTASNSVNSGGGTALTNAQMALASNSFFAFTLTADPGNLMNLSSLSFNAAKGGSGTRGYVVQTSAGGFSADNSTTLASGTIATQRPTFTNFAVDLSGAQFQGLTGITFRIFTYSGAVGSTVEYDNIAVVGAVQPAPGPSFSAVQLSSNQVTFLGTNGPPRAIYYVLSTTNLALPMAQWTSIATDIFDSVGAFQFTNTVSPLSPKQFFRLKLP
jgi:hypothetical protein